MPYTLIYLSNLNIIFLITAELYIRVVILALRGQQHTSPWIIIHMRRFLHIFDDKETKDN